MREDYESRDEAGAAWMERDRAEAFETAEPWVPEPPDEPHRFRWDCELDGHVAVLGVGECVECGEPVPAPE